MTTIINPGGGEGGNGVGMILGVIIVIVVLVLLFVYGLPAIRGNNADEGTNINIPDQIDINVDQAGGDEAQ